MARYKNAQGQVLAIGSDMPQDGSIATVGEISAYDAIEIPKQVNNDKWNLVKQQWDALTVTVGAHTFTANKNAMELMTFKANNMSSAAAIPWKEDWASFNTNIVELKEALNLAANAHQDIVNSVFGA